MNDLFELDPEQMRWRELSETTRGDRPAPRSEFGFTSANGKLYVFGGVSFDNGQCCIPP